MNRKNLLLFLLLAAVVAAVCAWYVFDQRTPSAASRNADVTVEAGALYTAFTQDESTAGKNYNDKVIQVSGLVRDVARPAQGPLTVTLETGDALGAVVCEFAGDQSPDWKKDQTVTLKGFCTGYLMDVVLTRCAVVE